MTAAMRETVNTTDKAKCCGCRTCEHVCPTSAIRMVADECGFLYPQIDSELCIHCGRCLDSCAFQSGYPQRKEFNPYRGYGIRHRNEEELLHSRSGAAFVAFSDVVLAQGGVVVGAGYDHSSSPFTIVHKCATSKEQRDEFRGAKYVQSNMQDVFTQVRELLEQGKRVLFSGTGCQVGALHKYLGREYDNLVTADIVCHGVQSPRIWAEYLELSQKELGQKIQAVDFRDKKTFGWGRVHVENLSTDDGEHFSVRFAKLYGQNFSRPSCFECPYCNKERPGDITLADFWGHEKAIFDLWDDEKGISLVLVNTQKGAALLEEAKADLDIVDCTGFRFQHMHLKKSTPKAERYDEFWDDYATNGLEFCLDKYCPKEECEAKVADLLSKRTHFDAGLIVFAANNYGSCATNIALYHAVENLGLKPIILDTLAVPDGVSRKHMRTYLNVSSAYSKRNDSDWANRACDSFLIGSDQCWRFTFGRFKESLEYFLLAFTSDNKRRISYASSFGMERYDVGEGLRLAFKNMLGRFHAVSVREDYAVNMCKRLFAVDAQQVADPVFLLGKEDYLRIAEQSQVETGSDYLLAYILEPSPEKRDFLYALKEKLGLPLKVICDAKKYKQNAAYFNMPEIVPMPQFVDWLSYFAHAKHVVSDSFHGTCFSLIMGKSCTIIKARVTDRFDSLSKLFGSCEEGERPHFFENIEEALEGVYSAHEGSEAVASVLASIRNESMAWLNNALHIPVQSSGADSRDLWLDYAGLKKEKFYYQYHYEESVRKEYEQIAETERTHLRTLRVMYDLPGCKDKPFVKEDLMGPYFEALRADGIQKYTLLLCAKEDCSTYWREFLEASQLPLMGTMGRRKSYYAIIHSGKKVAERVSSEPLDVRALLNAPANGKAGKAYDPKLNIVLDSEDGTQKRGFFARRFGKASNAYLPLVVSIHSMRYDKDNKCHKGAILVNNVDYSINMRGINVVVVENASGLVVDTFSIDLNGDSRLGIKHVKRKF